MSETLAKVTPATHPTIVGWRFRYDGREWGDWVPLTRQEEPFAKDIGRMHADALYRALVRQEGKGLPMEDLRILASTVAPWHDPERLEIQRANHDFKISDLAEQPA